MLMKDAEWLVIVSQPCTLITDRMSSVEFGAAGEFNNVEYNHAHCGCSMQEPVLVLNANFEPINVCTTRRAVVLILGGKAAMVANGRGYIHTVRELIPRPSVIRLELQVRRPRPRVKLTRREVFRRDNYTCQ